MTWADLIRWASDTLEDAGVDDPRLNAEYLALHTLGRWQRRELDVYAAATDDQERTYRALVARRATREPLQYIIGEWEFFGLRVFTSNAALIPRPETEVLVEEALKESTAFVEPTIVDIGTGSGAIAVALASRLPQATVVGIDVSQSAVGLARRNAERLGIRNAHFEICDILNEALAEHHGKVDLLVSNPPYVNINDYNSVEPELHHEPRIAITDEGTGLKFYSRILELAPTLLSSRGVLVFELGYDAKENVCRLTEEAGLEIARIVKDLTGIDRVLVARRAKV